MNYCKLGPWQIGMLVELCDQIGKTIHILELT